MDDQPMAPLCRRRAVLKAALGLAPWLISPARAEEPAPPQDPASAPPQLGDHLVFLAGPKKGAAIRSDDLELGGPQVQAYPADPSGVVRDDTRLNLVIVVAHRRRRARRRNPRHGRRTASSPIPACAPIRAVR